MEKNHYLLRILYDAFPSRFDSAIYRYYEIVPLERHHLHLGTHASLRAWSYLTFEGIFRCARQNLVRIRPHGRRKGVESSVPSGDTVD